MCLGLWPEYCTGKYISLSFFSQWLYYRVPKSHSKMLATDSLWLDPDMQASVFTLLILVVSSLGQGHSLFCSIKQKDKVMHYINNHSLLVPRKQLIQRILQPPAFVQSSCFQSSADFWPVSLSSKAVSCLAWSLLGFSVNTPICIMFHLRIK